MEEQEHKAQGEETRLAKDKAIIAQQQKQIEALTADLQKVSEEAEISRSTAQRRRFERNIRVSRYIRTIPLEPFCL